MKKSYYLKEAIRFPLQGKGQVHDRKARSDLLEGGKADIKRWRGRRANTPEKWKKFL